MNEILNQIEVARREIGEMDGLPLALNVKLAAIMDTASAPTNDQLRALVEAIRGTYEQIAQVAGAVRALSNAVEKLERGTVHARRTYG